MVLKRLRGEHDGREYALSVELEMMTYRFM
jgi:hypothetical protein